MTYENSTVICAGPTSPHAFDNIPLLPRNGSLDAQCPVCRGHGQWNAELDLASFRCVRAICGRCLGAGWIETGTDPFEVPDVMMSPDGHPMWTTRVVELGK